jgi:hypothetical protein
MTANDERKRRVYEERCKDDLRLYAWARGLPQIALATKTDSLLHNPKDSDELFVQLYTECLRITHTTQPSRRADCILALKYGASWMENAIFDE